MKTYEVTFLRRPVVQIGKQPAQVAKQIIHTDKDKFDIPVPVGYDIMSICLILPDLTFKNETTGN